MPFSFNATYECPLAPSHTPLPPPGAGPSSSTHCTTSSTWRPTSTSSSCRCPVAGRDPFGARVPSMLLSSHWDREFSSAARSQIHDPPAADMGFQKEKPAAQISKTFRFHAVCMSNAVQRLKLEWIPGAKERLLVHAGCVLHCRRFFRRSVLGN